MSKRTLFTCDMCDTESEEHMNNVSITMLYGGMTMFEKEFGVKSQDQHVCRECADQIKETVVTALYNKRMRKHHEN